MASPTVTGNTTGIGPMMPNYWDRVLGDNLRPNLYLFDFAEKRTLPRNFGTTIKIPRYKKSAITAALTEGVVPGACPISSQFISGTLKQFGGVFRHSDVVMMTALSDIMQGSLEQISYDIAGTMDTYIRNQLSGTGLTLFPGGFTGATSASVKTTTALRPVDWIRAKLALANQNNPKFPGSNCYGAVAHPRQMFMFQTFLSTNALQYTDISKYSENAVEKIFAGENGKWFGIKFVESTNVKVGSKTLSVANTSYATAMVFAPRAYYVTEINGDSAKTYTKPLGSGGATGDPLNQIASVGAKVFFLALPATWATGENRMVRLVTPLSTNTAL